MDAKPSVTAAPRVLFVLGSNGTGGTELQVRGLIAALKRRGVFVEVVLLDSGQGLVGLPPDTHVVAESRPGAIRGVLTYADAVRRVRHLVRDRELDVVHGVHARGYAVAAIAAAGLGGVRRVAWRRNLGIHLQGPAAALYRWIERMTLRATDVVLVNSHDVRDYWRAEYGVASDKLVVVPNMVQPWRFEVSRAPREGNVHVVAVGGLRPVKGHEVLVRAVGALESHEVQVTILGEGPCRESLTALAADLGVRLELPGTQPDPRPWLEVATMFVHPSLSEGSSNAVMEAMAAGLPIVASDVGGMRELVGDTAVLVGPGDVPALRAALEGLLRSSERLASLGAQARLRARDQFDEDAVVTATLDAYRGGPSCAG